MKAFPVKAKKLTGSSFKEVNKKALNFYSHIKGNTKRRPYIRSSYFNSEKIFLDLYWRHLHEKKNLRDKTRRLKYFPCSIELMTKCNFKPETKGNPNNKSEILHRFTGVTRAGEEFIVQIKENKKSRQKYLISTFPKGKQKSPPPVCGV